MSDAPSVIEVHIFFFFSSRRRHTRLQGDWSSDVCSSDLLWSVEGWLVWRLAGLAPLLAFLLLLAPSGLLALAWRERLGRVAGQAQAFLRFLADRDLHRRAPDERRALGGGLRAPARRGPPGGLGLVHGP